MNIKTYKKEEVACKVQATGVVPGPKPGDSRMMWVCPRPHIRSSARWRTIFERWVGAIPAGRCEAPAAGIAQNTREGGHWRC